ncbi:cation:proton antiporter [Kitasatospora sp. NPDC101183]|uniref:cation:proton antiporter n=1 Tax=Kitasatospora sp. NPDC101183 TaxID=3364100 RepID=UPI0037FD5B9E
MRPGSVDEALGRPVRQAEVPGGDARPAAAPPAACRLPAARTGRGGAAGLTTVLAGLLASGALAEWMGLHFVFGAFTVGLVVPRDGTGPLREEIEGGLGRVSHLLLMPVFFLAAGLKVDLSSVDPSTLREFALILLVAVGGRFGGAYLSARACRIAPRESAALAALMNTRGLTELVILSVGLQLGLPDTALCSLMVLTALVATAMTSPLVVAVHGPGPRGGPRSEERGRAVSRP